MWETAEESAALQQLIDESFTSGSSHLTSIMTPERRMSAAQVIEAVPSPAVLNIATVTARGEPRLSAVDGHFLHGHWYFTTLISSPKARQLQARPAISASYTPRDGMGVFSHGRAVELGPGPERQLITDRFLDVYGQAPDSFGDIYYARIDANWFVGFAMTPEEEREIERQRAERNRR
jgi:hypothetical protein